MALYETEFDPLRHEEWDIYWKFVQDHFNPVQVPDLELLAGLDLRKVSTSSAPPQFDPALLLTPSAKTTGGSLNNGTPQDPPASDDSDGCVTVKKKKARKSLTGAVAASDGTGTASSSHANDEPWEARFVKEKEARLESYMLTQRLIAALVDEGGGAAVNLAQFKSKGALREDPLWLGPADDSVVRRYQRAMEVRVRSELRELGLLDSITIKGGEDGGGDAGVFSFNDAEAGGGDDGEDDLVLEIRMQQERLRELIVKNRVLRNDLMHKVVSQGLKGQLRAREIKRANDEMDILYLERMIRKSKKNKRVRCKYQKILSLLYPRYKQKKESEALGATTNQDGAAVLSVKKEHGVASKSKNVKKKSTGGKIG